MDFAISGRGAWRCSRHEGPKRAAREILMTWKSQNGRLGAQKWAQGGGKWDHTWSEIWPYMAHVTCTFRRPRGGRRLQFSMPIFHVAARSQTRAFTEWKSAQASKGPFGGGALAGASLARIKALKAATGFAYNRAWTCIYIYIYIYYIWPYVDYIWTIHVCIQKVALSGNIGSGKFCSSFEPKWSDLNAGPKRLPGALVSPFCFRKACTRPPKCWQTRWT